MNFAAYVAFSFIIFLPVLLVLYYQFMYGFMFYMLLFNFINYGFLLLRLCILIVMYCSVYSVIIVPAGTLRLHRLMFFCAFFSQL